jgi:hypothetical protein
VPPAAGARGDRPGRPGDAQVEQLHPPEVDDDVRRLEVKVHDPAPVEVMQGGADMGREECDVGQRQRPSAARQRVLERLAAQGLEDEDRHGFVVQLVGADEVRVGTGEEHPRLVAQPATRALVVCAVGPRQLGDAPAVAAVAEDVVDVERSRAPQERDDLEVARDPLALAQDGRLLRDAHPGTASGLGRTVGACAP